LPPPDAQGSQGAAGKGTTGQPSANQASNTNPADAPAEPKRRVQRRVQRNTPDILRPLLSIPNLFR
jgi:hypothetical protein